MFFFSLWIEVLIVVTIFYLVLYIWWHRYTKSWSHILQPKGCLPFLGHMLQFRGNSVDELVNYFYNVCEDYSPTCVLFLLWKPLIISKDVQLCKTLLTSQKYIAKGSSYEIMHEWLGIGLLNGTGKKWKNRRQMLTPAFHLDILTDSITLLKKQSLSLVKHIKDCNDGSDNIDVVSLTKYFAAGTICEFAMGVPMVLCTKNPDPESKKFVESGATITELIATRFQNPLFWSSNIYKLTKDGRSFFENIDFYKSFVQSIIEARIQMHENTVIKKPKIFLDILLNAYQKQEIDIPGIIEEVSTFMFAGNETISMALSWTVFSLAKNKLIQEKLYNEIHAIHEKNLSIDESLKQAEYLDCVIKESLRLNILINFSRMIEEDSDLNGLKIPAGTEVVCQIYNIHLDEDNWVDSQEFRPERFTETLSEENVFKFLPFSAGPRNCIGKRFAMIELKMVLYYLILNFQVHIIREAENDAFPLHAYVNKNTEFQFTAHGD